jgi:hypothetical protein
MTSVQEWPYHRDFGTTICALMAGFRADARGLTIRVTTSSPVY